MRSFFLLITTLLICFLSRSYSQNESKLIPFLKNDLIFHEIKGYFDPDNYEIKNNDTLFYISEFKKKTAVHKNINLKYYLPSLMGRKISNNGFFVYDGKKIFIEKSERGFWDELDESSFEVYEALFNNREYLLITGTNRGASTVIEVFSLLIDITNKSNVKTYFMHSTFGGYFCFGDFNKDGILDYLKITRMRNTPSHLKVIMQSMKSDSFVNYKSDKYIIIKPTGFREFNIIQKKWFNK